MATMAMAQRIRWWVMLAEVTAATARALEMLSREELQTRVQEYRKLIGIMRVCSFDSLYVPARQYNFAASSYSPLLSRQSIH